jgi:hypothetical protein
VQVTHGISVDRARWEESGDALIVSGSREGGEKTLWRLPLLGGELVEVKLDPGFGHDVFAGFDLSRNGRTLAYVSRKRSGDLWMLEGKPGRL